MGWEITKARGALAVILVVFGLLVAGCGGGSDSGSSGSDGTDPASSTASSTTANELTTVTPREGAHAEAVARKRKEPPSIYVPEGEIPYKFETEELIPGIGKTAESGDKVSVEYVGINYNAHEIFENSWENGEPISFTIGTKEVVPGFEKGVEGMRVAGRRRVVIPPDLGYGAKGSASIGPNATLIFEIDLLSVK